MKNLQEASQFIVVSDILDQLDNRCTKYRNNCNLNMTTVWPMPLRNFFVMDDVVEWNDCTLRYESSQKVGSLHLNGRKCGFNDHYQVRQ